MGAELEGLLDKISLEGLKTVCDAMGLPKTGTKRDLIKRILSEKEKFLIVFPTLLNKASLDSLKTLAQKWDIKVTSRDTKKSLISKIVRKLKKVSGAPSSESKKGSSKGSGITERDVKKVAKLLLKIADSLVRIKNEQQLRDLIESLLREKKVKVTHEIQKEIEIVPGLPIPSRRDLIVEGIPIELKFIDDRRKLGSKLKEGLGQAVIYKKNLGKAILAIYDKTREIGIKKDVYKIEEGLYLVVL